MTAGAVAVLLTSCLPQATAQAPAPTCTIPRLATDYANTAPAQRPADVAPQPSVLPTPELTDAEMQATGDCMRPALVAMAAATGDPSLAGAADWQRFSTQFFAAEHGRYQEVFGNALAAGFLQFEDGPPLPVGAVIAKRGFRALQSGAAVAGPLFLGERMQRGYDPRVGDWKFTLFSETGAFVGETRGRNGDKVEYCVECHKAAWRQDFLFYVPPTYRPKN